ncbi:unnamed protein product [Effrenium voratum]|uniref:Uncharacterized protein n=1 Tax=Effrenium voratum TaxID=2562239 RepID=A0AA36J5Z6_9DINO|nr:unnamed protein product [Effrenium voratum]
MMRNLMVLLVVGALADKAEQADGPQAEAAEAAEQGEPSAGPGENSWNLVYCNCGLSCVKQVDNWYIFNVGQACACNACPEAKSTEPKLRGATGVPSSPSSPPVPSAQAKMALEAVPKESAPTGSKAKTWDGATMPGSNLLYCQCGKQCVDGRMLGLYTYYCFRYGCKAPAIELPELPYCLCRLLSCTCAAMMRNLMVLLVVGALADKAEQADEPQAGAAEAEAVEEVEQGEPSAGPGDNSWNLVYCNCGLSCVKQVDNWYIFNVGQACACNACSEANSTEAKLRGERTDREQSEDMGWRNHARQQPPVLQLGIGGLSRLLSCTCADMMRNLMVLLVVGALADKAEQADEPQAEAVGEVEQGEPSAGPGDNSWNLVYCNCGLSCVKQVDNWYIFNVGQACACNACPEANSTEAKLRVQDGSGSCAYGERTDREQSEDMGWRNHARQQPPVLQLGIGGFSLSWTLIFLRVLKVGLSRLLSCTCADMMRNLMVLLVVGALADKAEQADEPQAEAVGEVEQGEPSAGPGENSWKLVYCNCGLSCVKQVDNWYIFSVGQACACNACPEANSTEAKLRGAKGVPSSPSSAPVPSAQSKMALEAVPTESAPTGSKVKTWDGATMPGSNLLYCSSASEAGFESFENNSLEQLLINLCNEHLQQFFNTFVFRAELEDYAKEGLVLDCNVNFVDNADVLELVDGRGGVLDLLDEEVAMPKGTDESFVSKVKSGALGQHQRFVKSKISARVIFGVKHFAGEVLYNCEGFLQKNTDKQPEDFIRLLPSATLELLQQLKENPEAPPAKSPGRKTKSTSSKFRCSLRMLIGKINTSDPHFVRCIKPNAEKVPGRFDSQLVLEQLLFSGILEAVQIRQKGFASRSSFEDFLKRYGCIAKYATHTAGDLVHYLVDKMKLSQSGIQVGKTKVFLKAFVVDQLEAARSLVRNDMTTRLQTSIRARQAHQRFAAARPAAKAVETCLRRIGFPGNAAEVDDRLPLIDKVGPDARSFLTDLQQAESQLPNFPSSQRLRECAQAVMGRLTKELQCLEHLQSLAQTTDCMELEKALARADGLKLPHSDLIRDLQTRCKALEVQMPLREALQTAVSTDDAEMAARVADEVKKKGLDLQPKSWLPEMGMDALAAGLAELRARQAPKETAPEAVEPKEVPKSKEEPKESAAPSAPKHNSRRRPTFTGFSDAAQLQLLAGLQRAAAELDSVCLEQLLQQAMRNGVEDSELQDYHKLLRDLQSETFLRLAVEKVLEDVQDDCPQRAALQRLQNLSHQLRTLHGDAELIRAATRGVQLGTRRRTKSIAVPSGARRSVLDVTNPEDLRVACDAFCDLSAFHKLKSEGSWKGHRNSQLHFDFTQCKGVMLAHSKVTIAEALTHLPKSREATAVQNFRNILIWMGDRPAQECQRIASRERVIAVSAEPLLRDEVFVQLLKQLTGNPSVRSEWLGWQLLLQLCRTASPSDELDDFVRMFCDQARSVHTGCGDDPRAWEIARIAGDCLEALAAAMPCKPATEDTSGDMAGVLVYLIDRSYQNLFVPVASTLKELSSLMGSRVGVKHWRDFAFFQSTGDALRMLPDNLTVSELIKMWQQIREATGLQGHLHWRRRFLRPQEMLLAGDLQHAALTFRQAVDCHLRRPASCQAGAEAEEMATAAALLWLESYNPSKNIKDNDKLVCQLLKGQMNDLKPAQQDEVRRKLQSKVRDMRPEFGPRIPQLQRMTRAFALMRCFPHFGAHQWSAKVIAPAKVHAGPMLVNNPPERSLVLHVRQAEPDVWIFVDTTGLHVVPATRTHGAALWSFHFQPAGTFGMGRDGSSQCFASCSPALRRRSLSELTGDEGAATPSKRRMYHQDGRLLRWGAKAGLLQLVVHTADLGRTVPQSQLVALACPDAMDARMPNLERLRACPGLREVHLSHNLLSHEGVLQLAACVERRAEPLWLRVEQNTFTEPGQPVACLRVLPRQTYRPYNLLDSGEGVGLSLADRVRR